MGALGILSGGAAQGLVAGFAPAFRTETGLEITGEYGAVGGMADKLRNGAHADIIILTAALVARLADEGLVDPASIADLGVVETALAVRSGDPKVSVENASDLRRVLVAADAIFAPDMKISTAGIHVAKMLQQLGIADQVAGRLKIYPNGATAMRELAASQTRRPIGCTQSTEIIATKGVELSGALPGGCELATMYTAAVTTGAANATAAKALIGLLTSKDAGEARRRAGFL